MLECSCLPPCFPRLRAHGLIISPGLPRDILKTRHTAQHIFIYKKSEHKHHPSLLSVDGRFALMHPISRSKRITPASIKTHILLFGELFPYIYICFSFVSRCIYKVIQSLYPGIWGAWDQGAGMMDVMGGNLDYPVEVYVTVGEAVVHWSTEPGQDECERTHQKQEPSWACLGEFFLSGVACSVIRLQGSSQTLLKQHSIWFDYNDSTTFWLTECERERC